MLRFSNEMICTIGERYYTEVPPMKDTPVERYLKKHKRLGLFQIVEPIIVIRSWVLWQTLGKPMLKHRKKLTKFDPGKVKNTNVKNCNTCSFDQDSYCNVGDFHKKNVICCEGELWEEKKNV